MRVRSGGGRGEIGRWKEGLKEIVERTGQSESGSTGWFLALAQSLGRNGLHLTLSPPGICGLRVVPLAALADGDRFIPTRDGTDLHAAYQLLPDNGQDDRSDASSKPKNRRKSAYGQGTDVDARRGESSPIQCRAGATPLTRGRRSQCDVHPPPQSRALLTLPVRLAFSHRLAISPAPPISFPPRATAPTHDL
jgi:hypothetical protein